MATIQELESAIAAVGTAVTQYGTEATAIQTKLTDLIAKLASAGTVPDADVQSLTDIGTALGTANTALQAAIDQPA